MAAAALLGSLARKMARAPPGAAHHGPLLARGLHGSGPSASSLTIASAAGLGSLATKSARAPPHHRLVHSLKSPSSCGSTPPTSKIDLATTLAKIKVGAAYALLLGSLVYIFLPRLERSVDAKLEAVRTGKKLDDAIEALKIVLAEDVSTNGPDAQIMQSSGAGQPVGETGKGTSEASRAP